MKRVRVVIFICAALSLTTTVAQGQIAMGEDAAFGFGVRLGFLDAPDIDGFWAEDYYESWEIDGEILLGGDLYARLYILPFLGLEGHAGYYWGDGLGMDLEGLDLLLILPVADNFKPYAKGGVITGQFDWDGLGDFDRDTGFEAGIGMEVLFDNRGQFGVTADILYRDLENDYDPGNEAYWWSDDTLDLSGLTFQFGATFRF